VYEKLERMWKGTAVAYFKVVSQRLHRKPRSTSVTAVGLREDLLCTLKWGKMKADFFVGKRETSERMGVIDLDSDCIPPEYTFCH
jgi:hypothetical protein